MTEAPDEKPTPAIIESIKQAPDVIAELADRALEITTESEVLDNVPMISWAVKVLKFRDNFHAFRLKKNCLALLQALAAEDKSKVESFGQELFQDEAMRQEFEDTTFGILLDSEKPIKARLYGKLVASRINAEIDQETFDRLALVLSAASVPALLAVETFFRSTGGKAVVGSGGFVRPPEEPLLFSMGVAYRYGTHFYVDETGKQIYEICFDGQTHT